jgi:hypothetical protein
MKLVYRIPEENVEALAKKITAINKKAEKLGCGIISLTNNGEAFVAMDDKSTLTDDQIIMDKLIGVNREYYKVNLIEIDGTAPHIDGWEFMATLEHLDGQNIIRRYSNENIPEEYRTATIKCDHCGINRFRKDTYVIRNVETNEYKQVGSGCLKDFFNGRDPHNTAKYAELLAGLETVAGTFHGFNKPTAYIDVKDYLNYVEECIKKYDWIGRSNKEDFQTATADEAYNIMYGISDTMVPNNEDKVTAALEWLKSQPASSDFMHNVKTACEQEYITHRLIGYVAALMVTYNKHLESLKTKVDTSNSQYIGNPNDKIQIVLTLNKRFFYENMFGCGSIFKFLDSKGNIFIWRTGSADLEEGKTYTIKGTIKEHTEYKSEKQTHLTRCKVI